MSRRTIGALCVMALAATGLLLSSTTNKAETRDGIILDLQASLRRPGNYAVAHSLEHFTALSDLIREADFVVRGTVLNQKQISPLVVGTRMQIETIVKGTGPEEILVLQVGTLEHPGPDILRPGNPYLLFLGKQEDDRPDTYYVKGINHGIFFEDDQGRLQSPAADFLPEVTRRLPPGARPLEALENLVREMAR